MVGSTKFKNLHLGQYVSCGLSTDNKVYCWGRGGGDARNGQGGGGSNNLPQLIDMTNIVGPKEFKDVAVGEAHGCVVQITGDVYCWGYNGASSWLGVGGTTNQPLALPVLSTNITPGSEFKSVDIGEGHSTLSLIHI